MQLNFIKYYIQLVSSFSFQNLPMHKPYKFQSDFDSFNYKMHEKLLSEEFWKHLKQCCKSIFSPGSRVKSSFLRRWYCEVYHVSLKSREISLGQIVVVILEQIKHPLCLERWLWWRLIISIVNVACITKTLRSLAWNCCRKCCPKCARTPDYHTHNACRHSHVSILANYDAGIGSHAHTCAPGHQQFICAFYKMCPPFNVILNSRDGAKYSRIASRRDGKVKLWRDKMGIQRWGDDGGTALGGKGGFEGGTVWRRVTHQEIKRLKSTERKENKNVQGTNWGKRKTDGGIHVIQIGWGYSVTAVAVSVFHYSWGSWVRLRFSWALILVKWV